MTWRILFALVWLAATPAYAQFLYPLGLKPQAGGGGGGGGYTGPVVDTAAGAPTNQILNSVSGGPCAGGITTSAANETIFVVGVHETNNQSPAPTISAFSGGDGLPWAQLTTPGAGHNAILTDSASATAMFQTIEIWRARAVTAGTYTPGLFLSNTGSVNGYLAGAYICFAVSNVNATNPQDANASIAASGAGASSAPSVTGVSTTATSSLLIAAASTASPTIDCPGLTSSFPAGFTQIGTLNVTVASINYLCLAVAYKQVSAAQSGVSVTWGTSWPNWLSLVTALVP